MRDDNDLLPAVDTGILSLHDHINARRLRAWRLKWRLKFGVWPDSADIYLWPYQGRMTQPQRRPAHSNANIVKFPHRKRQYGIATLPSAPDGAA